MTTKPANKGIIHKILMLFIAINIIGDIGNVAFWWASPSSRAASLNTGYIGVAAGINNALIVGTIVLLVVAVVYIASFVRFNEANEVGITISHRHIHSEPRTCLSPLLHKPRIRILGSLDIILVVLAYLDWRKMKAQT